MPLDRNRKVISRSTCTRRTWKLCAAVCTFEFVTVDMFVRGLAVQGHQQEERVTNNQRGLREANILMLTQNYMDWSSASRLALR